MKKEIKKSDDSAIIVILILILGSIAWAKHGDQVIQWLTNAAKVAGIAIAIALTVIFILYFLFIFKSGQKKGSFKFGVASPMLSQRSIFSSFLVGMTMNSKKIGKMTTSILLNNNQALICNHPLVNDTVQKYHQLVLGASGSGKTYSVLQPQARHDIEQGKCLFIIDPKGDTLFSDSVYTYCKMCGREDDFRYFSMSSIEASNNFNPFNSPSINETKDLIISSTEWKEPYYKKMAESVLIEALKTMPPEERCLSTIIPLIPEKKEFTGLRADLNIMRSSDFGKLIDGANFPTLFDYYKENRVCYFSLNTQAYPEASVQLGKILLGGIMSISNYAQTQITDEKQRKPVSVTVDEFGSFISEPFINFLNKARSANFRVILATQSVGDLEKNGTQTRKQIADNTVTKIILAMSDPDSIEYAAKIFGTQEVKKVTNQIDKRNILNRETGTGSERDAQEFIVHPSQIRSLKRGEGYVMTQNPFTISKVKFKPKQLKIIPYTTKPNQQQEESIKNKKNTNRESEPIDILGQL